jgi:nucleotide-binding universal stress UspA family protein
MTRTILFPTDGSPLSEQAFPVALEIARAQQARMVMAQVVQYLGWLDIGPEAYLAAGAYQEIVDAMDADARRNLDQLSARAQAHGILVDTAVLHGSPAPELVTYEEQMRPDLTVMATHGRTGLARFALGSVADTMLREGTAPVLLIRSFGTQAPTLDRALVPLDGSALAEKVLPMVESLLGAPFKHIELIRAIAAPSEWADATAYLDKTAHRLKTAGVEVTFNVSTGEPVDVIGKAAHYMDLVVMATHGRGGLNRIRHGSVADCALHEIAVPILLIRSGVRSTRQPVLAAASIASPLQ